MKESGSGTEAAFTGSERSQDINGHLRAIFQAFPDIYFHLEDDGKIIQCIAEEASVLGEKPEDLTGRYIQNVFPPEIADRLSEGIIRVLRTGEVNALEFSLQGQDSDRWYEARLVQLESSELVCIMRDITTHKRSEERVQRQYQKLAALRSIDIAITSSFDLSLTLSVFLGQVTAQLGVDAANVLLLNPRTQILEYTAGRGFRTNVLQHTYLRMGEGYAGLAALERRVINIPNLQGRKTDFLRSPTFFHESFQSYFGVPLIAKGQVKGVLEIFHRTPLNPDTEWFDFLETLAGQAAIAVDSATMMKELQRFNAELSLAYDETIEGWSRALDLRDRETEGHTQRVTEITLRLALELGIKEEDMIHVRRGALLHDIGKMGIPDTILFKPGPLDEHEWKVMYQHPRYAYEMLSPIAYLNQALDIPYYHHEKWDGSGYPLGLKGKQIPLAARIFAVADVYDALTSNRPYRNAWPHNNAVNYIRDESGKHFDPVVVDTFFSKIVNNGNGNGGNGYHSSSD